MGKEVKICLPGYKAAYALCFTVILSLIRGIAVTSEIGIALEPPMAVLAMVFCADTYVQEIISRRWEIQYLYPMRNRVTAVAKRMVIQELFLFFLSVLGYGLFILFQSPAPLRGEPGEMGNELYLFLGYAGAVLVTLVFWGLLSFTVSGLFRNMWAGIGCSLVLWIMTNSQAGDRMLGKWNLFSYTFRNIENSTDLSWLRGKAVCIALTVIMAMAVPGILKKRG